MKTVSAIFILNQHHSEESQESRSGYKKNECHSRISYKNQDMRKCSEKFASGKLSITNRQKEVRRSQKKFVLSKKPYATSFNIQQP